MWRGPHRELIPAHDRQCLLTHREQYKQVCVMQVSLEHSQLTRPYNAINTAILCNLHHEQKFRNKWALDSSYKLLILLSRSSTPSSKCSYCLRLVYYRLYWDTIHSCRWIRTVYGNVLVHFRGCSGFKKSCYNQHSPPCKSQTLFAVLLFTRPSSVL